MLTDNELPALVRAPVTGSRFIALTVECTWSTRKAHVLSGLKTRPCVMSAASPVAGGCVSDRDEGPVLVGPLYRSTSDVINSDPY